MAEQNADIPSMDYPAHERTFAGFVELMKLVVLSVVTTLVSLVIIAFATSGFFKFIGFALIFVASIVAFVEFRLDASGAASLSVLVISLLVMVVAVA